MLLSYQACIDNYGSDYQIRKHIQNGTLFMLEKGIYSTSNRVSESDVIMTKYPKTVYTGYSAYFYHSLTDVIPDHHYLASRRTDTRIKDSRVIQSFLKDDIFDAGITGMEYNNSVIRIYNRERMLIELMRFKAKTPRDHYKEIISNYRQIVYELDFGLVEDYAALFKSGSTFMDMIQMEVL